MRQAYCKTWRGRAVPIAALSLMTYACSLNPQPLPPEAPGGGGDTTADGGAADGSAGTGLHGDSGAQDAATPIPGTDAGGDLTDGGARPDAAFDGGVDASDAAPADGAVDAQDEGG